MQDISREIIQKAAGGDMEAFGEIYNKTSGFVYNVAYRIVNNKEDAEEVAQDVFVNIFKKLGTFRFDASFKTWAYRITTNISINYLKRKIKQERNHVSYDDALEKKQITEPAAPHTNEPGQEEVIHSLLAVLNPDQRACIVLRNMEGLSYKEIAESLNININTVRSRLKRARTLLLAKKTEVMKQ